MRTRMGIGLLFVGLLGLGAFDLISWVRSPAPVAHTIVMDAYGPRFSVSSLDGMADIVAVVEPIGPGVEHWNNAANTPWIAPSGTGVLAMVVTDQQVVVIRAIRGTAESEVLSVRVAGGTVGDTDVHVEDEPAFAAGQDYLVFLERVQAPTQEGFDDVISPVAQGQGVFAAMPGGLLVNSAGETTVLPAGVAD